MSKFCEEASLSNEASVEALFATPLIRDLGYPQSAIAFKESIEPVEVNLGRRVTRYRPDYILSYRGKPRVIVDAKGADENLADWIGQLTSYCIMLNRRFEGENPVRYFVLTNGTRTLIFKWDEGAPLIDLAFDEVVDTHPKYQRTKTVLRPAATVEPVPVGLQHSFVRRSIGEVNAAFAWCHQHIYKNDNMSQAAGFTEFVKLIFLKLLSDRAIRDRHGDLVWQDRFEVPSNEVRFSTRWIADRESDTPNPMDSILFRQLVGNLETEIAAGRRKRIFEQDARIRLSAETTKAVVKKLESIFLFGIDIDLNGRLFETFLSATMRGKDLGQFFTPRSVVKLGTKLAAPRVNRERVETVLDGCCGTGGFLIDALAEMWSSIDENPTLSVTDKAELRLTVANHALYGIDIGKDPNQARLARMNMYLHGDGGTSIYEADFLDKELESSDLTDVEAVTQANQLRSLLAENPDGYFDVVLTNPPFAKEYNRKSVIQSRILDRYELGSGKSTVKSSILFFERYLDVLRPGGRMISVIDDGLLSGRKYAQFRDFLLQRSLVRAVVSLPGDAFQRSQARVKTSLIILEKRAVDVPSRVVQSQGPVFMYACQYVGIDDPQRQRTLPIDRENRELARREIADVVQLYTRFCAGESIESRYIVSADRVRDRLDVKSCTAVTDRLLPAWREDAIPTATLESLLIPVEPSEDDVIRLGRDSEQITYLVVGYDGYARAGATVDAADLGPANAIRAHAGQIVISRINAVHGSICVVPDELDGCVMTSEYVAFDVRPDYHPSVVWALLRTPEIRAEFLVRASGVGRTRVDWSTIKNVSVPLPGVGTAADVVRELESAEELLARAYAAREAARLMVETEFGLASEEAQATLRKFKPPS